MGNDVCLPACEVVSCNVEHSVPFNAKAKTQWSYTATPLIYRDGVNRSVIFRHLVLINSWAAFEIGIFSFS